jgi:PAS domain S-box-containing protein
MIKLDKLLKHSADLICTLDGQGRFVDVSEASFALLGYTPEEISGRLYTEFIDRVDRGAAAEALAEVVSGAELQIQNRYVHKNGQIVPLRWSVQWDQEDQLLYAIARSGRITEREEAMRNSLEESNKRYQYVSRATSDAIWDWDMVTGTLYWGENFETIFGYKLVEISPGIESWTAHICRDDAGRITKSIQAVLKSKKTIWKEEYRYRRADGTFADVVDRGFVIRDKAGTAVRMVGAMHDISERKQALKEMKRITDDLYKHNRELHEFGYIVSHNLRSPVANIMGMATLLETDKDDPETVAYCAAKLKTAISRLDEVILDLSKILNATDSSVELNAEPVDLVETIRNIETDLRDKILRNRAHLYVSPESFLIRSHKAYIYSIFFNLITNAIKYRSENDPVISVEISSKDAMVVRIKFNDNGRGIDLERHSGELFKPYKRFHTDVEGKGLGMFLVKSHIDVLGGEISVASEPGSGVAFTILLPTGNVT